jgi:hypothetical protein
MKNFFSSIIIATVASVGLLAACKSAAKPAATVKAPAPVADPDCDEQNNCGILLKDCETDADCEEGQSCVLEQIRDDADTYDPNSTDEPNRAPIVEERRFCRNP